MIRKSDHSLAELRILLGEARSDLVADGARGNLFNQKDLADAVGVTQAHISGLELGKSRPSRSLTARLAAVWRVDTTTVRAAIAETRRRRDAKEPQLRDVF